MADICDRASDRELIDTERAIAAARAPLAYEPVACGHCYNCDEPVGDGLRFCDECCRDDYQARKAAR